MNTSPTPLNILPTQQPPITKLLIPTPAGLTLATHAVDPAMRDAVPDLPFCGIDLRPQLHDPPDPLVAADGDFGRQVRDRASHEVQVCRAHAARFDAHEDLCACRLGDGFVTDGDVVRGVADGDLSVACGEGGGVISLGCHFFFEKKK